ncbi:MAG: type II toxin-antitoxin system RelE/ParE family toxin [Acidimicrobiales bacterium]
MRFEFEDDDLRRLYTDPGFHLPKFGTDLTKQYRKKMQVLAAAKDERDLYALRGLRLEKLVGAGAGQHSIRLNDQFRLILRFKTDHEDRLVIVVKITDYH